MAYTQDISLLMRELLKVPKDNTPTALEITRYIQARYKIGSKDESGKRKVGSRSYSSAAPHNVGAVKPKEQPKVAEVPQQSVVGSTRKMSRRALDLSPFPLRATPVKPQIPPRRKFTTSTPKRKMTLSQQNKTYSQSGKRDDKWEKRELRTGPEEVSDTTRPTLWNWQRASSRIRQVMSSVVAPNSMHTKNKLMQLAEQHKVDDVKIDQAQDTKKKQMLSQLVDTGYTEPLRARELIQKLLEDNKVETQKREIAKLMEIAKAKVLEARKAMREDKLNFCYGSGGSKPGRMTA